jgi:glycosyltransferase involved in cell wall biosynthesis
MRAGGGLRQLLRQALLPVDYLSLCMKGENGALYLGLSGGKGQAIDLPYLLIARALRRPIFVHHHSFAYIDRPSFLSGLVFRAARRGVHIVLSQSMGAALAARYKLKASQIRVVSNAGVFPPSGEVVEPSSDSGPIRIGFLSNITFEKGFVEYFEVLKELARRGVDYRAGIAGPIAPEAQQAFDALLASSVATSYVGPVYGAAKDSFLSGLDVLLFPTKYANEAEPLVIHEALRQGVHVIATNRGAIAEILENGAGRACDQGGFVADAADYVQGFSVDRGALNQARKRSIEQSRRMRTLAESNLSAVLAEITA